MIKEAVITEFSKRSTTYAEHANVQFQAAQKLAAFMAQRKNEIVAGPVLELGCGTGFLTEHLLHLFPDREIIVTDLSPEMLSRCRAQVPSAHAQVSFQLLDAEDLQLSACPALIASSFTLQWVSDFSCTLKRLTDRLQEKGQLFLSLPVSGSFKEWQQACRNSGVPFTANALPSTKQLRHWCGQHNYSFEAEETEITCMFDCALSFFRSLKNIGASVNISGNRLNAVDFSRLLGDWDNNFPGGVAVTYLVLKGRITKADHK